jgi:hypothetical protein
MPTALWLLCLALCIATMLTDRGGLVAAGTAMLAMGGAAALVAGSKERV